MLDALLSQKYSNHANQCKRSGISNYQMGSRYVATECKTRSTNQRTQVYKAAVKEIWCILSSFTYISPVYTIALIVSHSCGLLCPLKWQKKFNKWSLTPSLGFADPSKFFRSTWHLSYDPSDYMFQKISIVHNYDRSECLLKSMQWWESANHCHQ